MSDNVKAREGKLEPKDGTNQAKSERERSAGIDGDYNFQKVPEFKKTEYENVIQGPYASHICLGADRINSRKGLQYGDGKGGQGVFASSHIDLVAGLDSVDTYKGRVPTVPLNPDAFRDASRVYISENCDVDKQFMCSEGSIGNVENKAAVVVKSDQVRIIGREGIKIITGTDTWNSRGREIYGVAGIDFIPGNISTMTPDGIMLKLSSGHDILQPVPRGHHLVACFEDIIEKVENVIMTIDSFLKAQQKFNNKIMKHTHHDFVAKACGLLATQNPNSFFAGKVGPSDECIIGGAEMIAKALKLKTDLKFDKGLFGATRLEYLNHLGGSYINSRGVKTT
jgi:hypothetical protein